MSRSRPGGRRLVRGRHLSAGDLFYPGVLPGTAVDVPAGIDAIEDNYTPAGDLRIPALTLSTPRDPVVPGFHRTVYGQEVTANGSADLLVQRSVPGFFGGYGHCTFTPQELSKAFLDLVLWGEYGVKPTP